MIQLELTSIHYGSRVFILTDTLNITDKSSRPPSLDSVYNNVGCVVADGKHNNGGFSVRESYDEVVKMVKEQLK